MTADPIALTRSAPASTDRDYRADRPAPTTRPADRGPVPTLARIPQVQTVLDGAVQIARGPDVRVLLDHIGLTSNDRDIVLAELDRRR